MRNLLRNIVRDYTPPVLFRTLDHALRGNTHRKSGAITRRRRDHVVVDRAVNLFHRGSPADLGVITQVFEQRDYDLSRFQRFAGIESFYTSCEKPLILDCGANIGASAVWFARNFPKARIAAIEPEPRNFQMLLKNTEPLEAVVAIHGADAGHGGRIAISDPGEGAWAYRAGSTATGAKIGEVDAYAIQDIFDRTGGTPFILKIDVEGAEKDIFSNPSPVLAEFPVLIVELHDRMFPKEANSRAFIQWHAGRDRDFIFYGENLFSFSNTM